MATFKVVAREIRSWIDGEFLHPAGKIIELDDDDSRVKHYRDMRAIVPVRRKHSADGDADETEGETETGEGDANAEPETEPADPTAPTE